MLRQASPNTWASPDDPPVLMIQGDQDSSVPLEQSQIFRDALQTAGVASELVIVENAGHGFGQVGDEPINMSLDEISQCAVEFLESFFP